MTRIRRSAETWWDSRTAAILRGESFEWRPSCNEALEWQPCCEESLEWPAWCEQALAWEAWCEQTLAGLTWTTPDITVGTWKCSGADGTAGSSSATPTVKGEPANDKTKSIYHSSDQHILPPGRLKRRGSSTPNQKKSLSVTPLKSTQIGLSIQVKPRKRLWSNTLLSTSLQFISLSHSAQTDNTPPPPPKKKCFNSSDLDNSHKLHIFIQNCEICQTAASLQVWYTVMAQNISTLDKYDQRRLWKFICNVNPFNLFYHKNQTFHWMKISLWNKCFSQINIGHNYWHS